jgi:transposase-like protein
MTKRLSLEERQEIFQALVETQDVIADVPRSRQMIAKKFGITEATIRQIEEEGIDRQWPPLEDEPKPAAVSE